MITKKTSFHYIIVMLTLFVAVTVHAIDIKTSDGREFKNAEILRQEPDRITIVYPRGGATIYLYELTDDLQRHFNYTPKEAKEYREGVRERQAIEATGRTITWRVSQLISEEVALGYTYLNGANIQICVVGPFANYVVDDRIYRDKLYPAGRYTFTTVQGAQRTVPMYALAPDLAQALINKERDPIPNRIQEVASSGTGWFAGDGVIVTCWHVIENKETIYILSPSLVKHQVIVIGKDTKNDIAVLVPKDEKIRSVLPKGLSVASRPPVLGQEVFTIGYPFVDFLGKEPKVTDGVVSALSGPKGDIRFLQVTVAVQPGNSGGPLINRRGEVVGIITSKLSALAMLMWSGDIPENVNFAVKSNHLVDLLQKINRHVPGTNQQGQDGRLSDVVQFTKDAVVMVIAE